MERLAVLVVAISTWAGTSSATCITRAEAARNLRKYIEDYGISKMSCAFGNTTSEQFGQRIEEIIRTLNRDTEIREINGVNREVLVGYSAQICFETTQIGDSVEEWSLQATIDCQGGIELVEPEED